MLTLASTDNLSNIDRAWEEFVKSKKIDDCLVRPIIMKSWERCRSHGIDPYTKFGKEVLTGIELKKRLDRHCNLIRVAVPFMQLLIDTCGEGFKVLLVDKEGYVLEMLGDPELLALCEQDQIGKGANVSERVMGTNTLGTVLVERTPMQVAARENYCQVFHDWTSSGAPILDPNGRLIGALGICGHYSKVHPHTMGMVVAAVKAIENQLQLEKVHDELKKAHDFSKAVMESITEGLITVDQKGNVNWINAAGGRIMGVEPKDYIGHALHELGSALMSMQEVLYEGSFSDREIVLENKRGRFHFIMTAQPIKNESEIIGAVSTLREIKDVHRLVTNMVGAKARFTFDNLIGDSEVFQKVCAMARKAAASNSTVLLQGESGTGKELFAQAIHNASMRAQGPFVAVNCAAIPRELIESELFGYEEGAFTGARRGGCSGKFELASGGTVFLDEIGDMPLDLQVTLLRFLQEKQVTRLGGRKVIPVDVRIIAATNRDLKTGIQKGEFREDLFYRLNIFSITIPPLRERQPDISLLANYFASKISRHQGKALLNINPAVMARLTSYPWPGNVRELENALERAINVAAGEQILVEHLPDHLRQIDNSSYLKDPGTITCRASNETESGAASETENSPDANLKPLPKNENYNIALKLYRSNETHSGVARKLGVSILQAKRYYNWLVINGYLTAPKEELSKKEKDVVCLLYEEGLSLRMAAEKLECSINNVVYFRNNALRKGYSPSNN